MSQVIKHEQCPECAKHGRDRSRDNLAIYADGGAYCFSCGYTVATNAVKRYLSSKPRVIQAVFIPPDSSPVLPERATEFLRGFGITELDIKLHNILWSEETSRIIFPIIIKGDLLAWAGRYLGTGKSAKWYISGKLHEICYHVGNSAATKLVLVEDIISAIRLAHDPSIMAMPIFGSHISQKRLLTIKRFYDMEVIIWLDNDKKIDSFKFVNRANALGLTARSIVTEKDPKCYSTEEVTTILDI